MQAPIYTTSGMTREVGGTITELNGADIRTDAVAVGLSTSPTVLPTSWLTPTTVQAARPSTLRVLLLIDSTFDPGTYWVWVRITDGAEIEPLMFPDPVRVA